MPARIRLPNGQVAAIDSFEWTSDDAILAEQLNLMKADPEDGISQAVSPDPDLDEAERVVRIFGGTVFDHEQFMDRVPGRIY